MSSGALDLVRILTSFMSKCGLRLSMHLFLQKQPPDVFCDKSVLRNFAKFTGEHLCQSLFFNKVEGLKPVTLLEKKLGHKCFSVNFAKFLRTPFIIELLWWLLLFLAQQYVFFKHILYCLVVAVTFPYQSNLFLPKICNFLSSFSNKLP